MINKELLSIAKKTLRNAYSPYSKVKVGAAILTESGNIYTGCNIENASYGLTICAERTALCNAISAGGKKLKKIAIASNTRREFSPCGACRQALAEFNPKMEVIWLDSKRKIKAAKLTELLPSAFKK